MDGTMRTYLVTRGGYRDDEFPETFEGILDYLAEVGADLAFHAGSGFLGGYLDSNDETFCAAVTVITADEDGVTTHLIEATALAANTRWPF